VRANPLEPAGCTFIVPELESKGVYIFHDCPSP